MTSTNPVRQAREAYRLAVSRDRDLHRQLNRATADYKAGKITLAQLTAVRDRCGQSAADLADADGALVDAKRDSANRVRYAQDAHRRAVRRCDELQRQYEAAEAALKAGKIGPPRRDAAWRKFAASINAVGEAEEELERAKEESR